MSIKESMKVGSVKVDVIRKDIKNMHLAVYPPNGRIRLSVPENTDSEVARLFAVSKLSWIKKQAKRFQDQPRETPRLYVSGESHYYMGKRYLLEVVERYGKHEVEIKGTRKLLMYVRANTTREKRRELMKKWYRDRLKEVIPELIEKWEGVIGVNCGGWSVRHMRTKWGSCNTENLRITLNLELAKKPLICTEFIVVHELVHLIERRHNDRFVRLMDKYMPKWRLYRDELNELPLNKIITQQ